eukprot:1154731-Pelagomonas_calceolata.AAC.3
MDGRLLGRGRLRFTQGSRQSIHVTARRKVVWSWQSCGPRGRHGAEQSAAWFLQVSICLFFSRHAARPQAVHLGQGMVLSTPH